MPPYKPVAERFAAKFIKGGVDECWLWHGAKQPGGYGILSGERAAKGDTNISAHRFAYEQISGPIPLGKIVLHDCDNPSCVNPTHLFLGTHAENMKDMARKGRARILTDKNVREVIKLAPLMSQYAIARHFGVSHSTIQQALKRAAVGDYGGDVASNPEGRYRRLSDQDRTAILALLNERASVNSIAIKFGVDRKTVRNLRDKSNASEASCPGL
jgi:transposase-like protein